MVMCPCSKLGKDAAERLAGAMKDICDPADREFFKAAYHRASASCAITLACRRPPREEIGIPTPAKDHHSRTEREGASGSGVGAEQS